MAQPGEPAAYVVELGDSSLQPLLDKVWVPWWESGGEAAVEREDKRYPGRELARKRLAAKRQGGSATP